MKASLANRSNSAAIPAWIQKLKIPAWIFAGLLSLYAVSGFWLAPYLIKTKLPDILEQRLGRTGSIQEVSINPFLFKVDLKGFTVQSKSGARFVGFDEFFVDFEWSSLIRRAAVFDEIRLAGLFVGIEKFKDGGFNFDDLLVPSGDQKPEPENDSSPFPVRISRLDIREGSVVFEDQSRKRAFRSQISPINLSVSDFQTYLDSGSQVHFKANFDSGGTLDWQGDINITPLRSNGRITLSGFRPILIWRYIEDAVNFEISDGTFNLDAQYSVHHQGDALQVKVSDGKYVLENLKITRKGDAETLIELPQTTLDGISFDLIEQKLSIASFASEKGRIHAWVRPDKEMNFVDVFVPVTDSQAVTPSQPPSTTPSDDSTWLVRVRKVDLNDYGFLFEDRSLATTMKLDFKPLDISLENFSSDLAGTLPFTIKAAINQSGHLDVAGGLGLKPLATVVKLDLKLHLTDFQPYIDPVTKLAFADGDAIVKGDVDFKLKEGSKPQLTFNGMASIDDFVGQDKVQNEKLLDWKTLKFEQVDFNLDPIRVSVKEVIADRAYTRFIINADGTTNFSKVFGGEQAAGGKAGKSTATTQKNAEQSPDPLVQIDTVRVKNASAKFADLSLKPGFATGMESLNGIIRGFSTDKKSRARIDLKGKADQTAPVHIKGQIQFFNPERYTDIGLDFNNLSLSSLTPYSGKFAGYQIEKGNLSVDLKYKIEQKKLLAENNVVIKQLTLGEKVESPDAVSLPLSLAIALLQDADGVINLDLPLRGSLDDPEFSIWGIIGEVLLNLITKVVTSPFAALGSLIDGDEALDSVGFGPGESEIAEGEKEKLGKLAEALAQRPALNIEVKGVATGADAARQFRNGILAANKSELAKQNPNAEKHPAAPKAEPELTDEEFRRHLLRAYYMRVAGMKILALNAPMIDQSLNSGDVLGRARRKVYGTMLSEDAALRDLAQSRGRNIREYLISRGLNQERVFLLDVNLELNDESESDSEKLVLAKLSLTAD
ncbi:MAG: DUF748 domain-containing protein [Methylococcales bacterium]